jgi:hypothetical protein
MYSQGRDGDAIIDLKKKRDFAPVILKLQVTYPGFLGRGLV